jgi:hypothetical protein
MNSEDKITLAWCDTGMVRGEFTQSVSNLLMNNRNVNGIIRSFGKNINLQRQEVLDYWMKKDYDESDWLLWIDSDIEFSNEDFLNLAFSAKKENFPVIAGVYLLIIDKDQDGFLIPRFSFSLKKDEELSGVKEVEYTGFGMILIHRSVVKKMYNHFGNKHLFNPMHVEKKDSFIGEDVYFCSLLKEAEVPIHVNFDVFVNHHKNYPLDKKYLELYMNGKIC